MDWPVCRHPASVTSASSDYASVWLLRDLTPVLHWHLRFNLPEIRLFVKWPHVVLLSQGHDCGFLPGVKPCLPLYWGPVAPTCAPQLLGSLPLRPGTPPYLCSGPLAWISPRIAHPLLVVAYSHQDHVCLISCSCCAHLCGICTPWHLPSPLWPSLGLLGPCDTCPWFADFPLFPNALQPYFLVANNNFHFFNVKFYFF